VLAVTSNPSAQDFQYMQCNGKPLYLHVVEKVREWNKDGNLGLVVGASMPEQIAEIRDTAPELPFLIPGVGAQGGDLNKSVTYGKSRDGIITINVSRGIIFASDGEDFAEKAAQTLDQFNYRVNELG
jgi:orotidine-5'-phosphate decarboxylase